jgi:DNA-directed RNA polymerase subunit alpha
MVVKYGKFEMPHEIDVDESTATATFARFIAEPFERGYGHTVGNAMRRVLLTSLEAPAIVSLRIEGVPHEYAAIEGVVEDMTHIILNLKGALLRRLTVSDEPGSRDSRILTTVLEVTQDDLDRSKGQVKVTLADVMRDSVFEVVNPQLVLFSVTKPMRRQIDLRVSIGRGYVPSERHVVHHRLADEILLDSAFSPVRNVNYFVENTRVGQDTDYDRLILDITTDGRVRPAEALAFASQITMKHLEVFNSIRTHELSFQEIGEGGDGDFEQMMDKLSLRIDEIELSVRSANCLAGANIDTIAELVSIPERKMLEFRNFGKKSLNEIKAKLSEMGLYLGMDLSRYGVTVENIKEKVREYQEIRRGRKELAKSEDNAEVPS